ncbi:MAG: effector binding domain-containing protein [Gammaproteobacteria bacterium]|nr:effector binding domain-containing protein [Gammaproteobacteria bacterium]MCH9743943.1 effector binding domain-containing protein [Gammaproteobacteria bacterium]
MQKQQTSLDEIILIGLTARTNNQNEMNPEQSKIARLAGTYWGNQVANDFKHRTNPGITYSVYTEYESDENGEYTYFVGEQVDSLDGQDLSKYKKLIIPKSNYTKFTTDAGKMPEVVIGAWQQIWSMSEKDFMGKRAYIADFEIYDQRAADPSNAIVDIYIGLQ